MSGSLTWKAETLDVRSSVSCRLFRRTGPVAGAVDGDGVAVEGDGVSIDVDGVAIVESGMRGRGVRLHGRERGPAVHREEDSRAGARSDTRWILSGEGGTRVGLRIQIKMMFIFNKNERKNRNRRQSVAS